MRHLKLDDPQLTAHRGQILKDKKFLRKLYIDWYNLIDRTIESSSGIKIEMGSGAGFIEEEIGHIFKSDILMVPNIHLVLDSMACPFMDESVTALVMVDVLHHLAGAECFFEEAQRILVNGGQIVMIEPWITAWSKNVFRYLHYEPIDTEMESWHFTTSGPLSGANEALPWIIFERDRQKFEKKYPSLKIAEILPIMPFRYLLSGGMSTRISAPEWSYPVVKFLDRVFKEQLAKAAMFALIVLQKTK